MSTVCLLPSFLLRITNVIAPGAGCERRWKGESEKLRAEGVGRREEETVNATGCGKFEYGICLLVSPSLFAKAGRKERTGCEGRMRFVIGATSAVCKVALMFAPFVLSRPHLSGVPLLRFSPRSRRRGAPRKESSFSLIALFLFLSSPYPSYI